jgi:MFS family permease
VSTDQIAGGISGSPFALRDFRLYWGARFIGSFAVQIITVAIGWQLYDATRDPFLLGMVGLAEFLPSIVLVLLTGAAADRFDRITISAICLAAEAVCAAALLWIFLAGGSPLLPIFIVLVGIGIARAFIGPALQSVVTGLVPSSILPAAIAWNTSSWQIASVTGPVAGGLLYGLGGEAAYAVAMLMLIASLVMILMVPRSASTRASTGQDKSLQTLFAGISYVRSQPIVLGAISLDLFAVLLGGATALLPAYARDILEAGPWALGLLRAAPGAGAIAMGIYLARYPIRAHAGILMFAGVAMFGVFTVVFGLSTVLWLSILSLAIMGAADMISVYVRETLIQLATPDELRGRVNAVNMVFIGASNELGAFRAGTMAAFIGVVPAVVIGGIGAVIVAGLWAHLFPMLRRTQQLDGR